MFKHILVISQYFFPEPFRINDMCCEWIKRGYKVTVITGIPNYPEGKFYKEYSWFKNRRETWNGINIIRIPLFPRGKSSLGLVMNYLSFVVSGFFWNIFNRIKADVVFTFEVSPMTQALIGVWYAKKYKIKHFLYVQDLWPDNVEIVTGIRSSFFIKPINKMVDYIYKNSDLILATSPSFKELINQRISNSEDKVKYWPQYAEEFYKPLHKSGFRCLFDDSRFKIVFTGNIGKAQGLDVLISAANFFSKNHINDICFVLIGDGRNKEELQKAIMDSKTDRYFIWINRQPPEMIPEYLSECDAAFISFMDNPLFFNTIPAKLQSYLACGMPIVAAADGETARIISEADCGVCSAIGDGSALAKNIIKMKYENNLRKYSLNAREYFLKNFEKQMLMDEFDVYLNM